MQAACVAAGLMLVLAMVFAPPAPPSGPADLAPRVSQSNAAPSSAPASLSPELSSILEARRELGSVLEGTSLDVKPNADDFVRSLERLARP